MRTLIHNARVVTPQAMIEPGWLLIDEETILDLGPEDSCPDEGAQRIDVRGALLLPGLIDLHCDAIEKFVEPRPNVHIDLAIAFNETDWRLAGSGITTEFHAISLDDNEFGVRSPTFLSDFTRLVRASTTALVRHKLHVRWEVTSEHAYRILPELIASGTLGMLSLMDHTPGQGQYQTDDAFRAYVMKTTGRSAGEVDGLIERKRQQAAAVPERVAHITALAQAAQLPMATHDDDSADRVATWPDHGIAISEFPTTIEAAREAHRLGLSVCMGAPNALRMVSSGGNLSAITALEEGLVDVLCSDYYPSAMIAAPLKLSMLGICTLPEAINLVSRNPAQAVRLAKYGTLERGNCADLIVVEPFPSGAFALRGVFVDGEMRLDRGLLTRQRSLM